MLQELSDMDRITQLQDELQQLLTIMSQTLVYLTTRTNLRQVSEHIPVTVHRKEENYDPPDKFESNQKEMVNDLIVKAKQIELLINSLPEPETEEAQHKRLMSLQDEMRTVNEEFREAVTRAKKLHAQIRETLRTMLDIPDVDLEEVANSL